MKAALGADVSRFILDLVAGRSTLDNDVRAVREVDGRGQAAIAAEHHIAGAGIVTAVRVGTAGADEQIVDAIAIDVASVPSGAKGAAEGGEPPRRTVHAGCGREGPPWLFARAFRPSS